MRVVWICKDPSDTVIDVVGSQRTYRLGVGGDDALHQLETKSSLGVDLELGEGNPLVDESGLLRVGTQESGVRRESGHYDEDV